MLGVSFGKDCERMDLKLLEFEKVWPCIHFEMICHVQGIGFEISFLFVLTKFLMATLYLFLNEFVYYWSSLINFNCSDKAATCERMDLKLLEFEKVWPCIHFEMICHVQGIGFEISFLFVLTKFLMATLYLFLNEFVYYWSSLINFNCSDKAATCF
ncbi:Immunoglobulin-like fold-containing protein [Dioscorea alata]|uniref:Immunoglobulin-like fold-containing protein n=1 Tax=Dioscorea alata TaxID=55571 RepID=A0ACB7UXG2_DIOAL|nr:Immunoglobulin-like fold-containing protein [Dioscorea alata]